MSYNRVIPRDLFNESNLLKCYGRLYILSETTPGLRVFDTLGEGEAFDIQQDQNSGALTISNVHVEARGHRLELKRIMNSRDPWPLFVEAIDGWPCEPVQVFADNGNLHPEFLDLMNRL
jgi:hypothetical protein